ncbi:hypothetical protein Ndes2526B_g01707 [Nannochloris sp. 'desiccata']|nr:hypothetical protein NADE_002475 [Chlorella desiccata (nom. nud.)]
MTDSGQTTNPWQEPPEDVLQGVFEFFLTLEDGEPLLRVCSHVCSRWREAALEIRLSDTGTSRPAGWRYMPLPEVTAPRVDRHPSPPAPSNDNKDEAETSIQAAIVKFTAENSVSVCYGGEAVSSREGIDSKQTENATAKAAPHLRRKNIKRAQDYGNPGRLNNCNNNSNLHVGGCINLTVDASLEGEGAEIDKSCGSGGGGGGSKRQKLLAGGVITNKRHARSNRGVKAVVGDEEEGNKEEIRTENGGATESPQQRQQFLECEERNDQQELGWASKFWEVVQRFARRI